ncbi:MAG: hypothetical protein U0Q16_38895 [Bryobacteraceae bacterium]
MDLRKAIEALIEERERIDRVIHCLEGMERPPQPSTRGRKDMSAEERKQVSARMKRYWAMRRKQKRGDE